MSPVLSGPQEIRPRPWHAMPFVIRFRQYATRGCGHGTLGEMPFLRQHTLTYTIPVHARGTGLIRQLRPAVSGLSLAYLLPIDTGRPAQYFACCQGGPAFASHTTPKPVRHGMQAHVS